MTGRYNADGKQLTITPIGTTMMAYPQALMAQEHKLLSLLPSVEHYSLDRTGALVLTTADGNEITARR